MNAFFDPLILELVPYVKIHSTYSLVSCLSAVWIYLQETEQDQFTAREIDFYVDTASKESSSYPVDDSFAFYLHVGIADLHKSTIEEDGGTRLTNMEKYLSVMGYNTSIVMCDKATHVYVYNARLFPELIQVKLAVAIPLLMPFAFKNGEYKLTDVYKNITMLIDKGEISKAWSIMQPVFEHLSENKIESDLKNLFVNTYEKQIESYKQQIRDCDSNINDYGRLISEQYRKKESLSHVLTGLMINNNHETNYSEFISYINQIGAKIIAYSNNKMHIRFTGYADNIDPEESRLSIENLNSAIYEKINPDERENLQYLLLEVFVRRKYRLRTASVITIFTDTIDYSGELTNDAFTIIDGKTFMYNPHIMRFNCFGTAKADIYEALSRYDYYFASVMMQAANGNLNFGDPTVICSFGKTLNDHKDEKIFVGKDGIDYSAEEIIFKKGTE